MSAALAYGSALLVSGWLLSGGFARAKHVHFLETLGLETLESKPERDRRLRIDQLSKLLRGRPWTRLAVFAISVLVGHVVLGLPGVLLGPASVGLAAASQIRRRRQVEVENLDRQLAEAVVGIAAAVRAGLSVRQAVAEAAHEADQPLRTELESVVERLRTGEPLDVALGRLEQRLHLPDARLLVGALTIHSRIGGDLPKLLEEIASVIQVRLDDRRSVRALTAQARSSGAVLAVLPIGFVALLSGTGGDGLGAFYSSPRGLLLVAIALALQLVGFGWMRLIVRRVEMA